MIIVLPFPPAILNPNKIAHWAKKSPIKAQYKYDCKMLTLASGVKPPEGRIHLEITFYPPRNVGDIDNFLAAMKSGIDGVAEAWQVNDKCFRPLTIDVAEKDASNPRVEIRIK